MGLTELASHYLNWEIVSCSGGHAGSSWEVCTRSKSPRSQSPSYGLSWFLGCEDGNGVLRAGVTFGFSISGEFRGQVQPPYFADYLLDEGGGGRGLEKGEAKSTLATFAIS